MDLKRLQAKAEEWEEKVADLKGWRNRQPGETNDEWLKRIREAK